MQFGVLVTNGPGGHPSWKHAEISAWKVIIDPEPGTPDAPAKTEAAAELRRKVRDALEQVHENVKQHAFGQLNSNAKLEPQSNHLDQAVLAIQDLSKGTILESHYQKPEVVQALKDALTVEFLTQQNIHRAWHNAGFRE